MKPIKLELSGLNSYKDKVVIDFEKLVEKGLFGIFGDTGSGKSTILDGITLALYGVIPRNTKEFINSNCDKATILYEFEIGSKISKRRYNVSRVIERTSKGIETTYAKLSEVESNKIETTITNNIETVNKKIINIIGLTASDFMRCVVIPQGKFNEFLKLTGSERRDMLERIFNLERYGKEIIDKIERRKSVQVQNLLDTNSKLSQYDDVSEELHESIEKDLINLKELEKIKTEDFESYQDKYIQQNEIYEKQIKKEKYEKRKKELDLKNKEIKEKSMQLENALNAEKVNPYIQGVQELEKKVTQYTKNSESLKRKIEVISKELIISKNKYDEAYSLKNVKVPKLSEEKIRLQRAINLEESLTSLDEDIKNIRERENSLYKEKEILKKTAIELDSKKITIIKSAKELESNIEKLKISVDLKQKILLAYEKEKEYNKILDKKSIKESKMNEVSKNLEDISLKIKYVQRDKSLSERKLNEIIIHNDGLIEKCPCKNDDILNKNEEIVNLRLKISLLKESEVKKEILQLELNKLLESKHQIQREINLLNEKLDLAKKNRNDLEKEIEKLKYLNLSLELRKQLKENYPCPVCGSRHHENKEEVANDEKIAFLQSKLDRIKNEETVIKNSIDELNGKNSECISIERIKKKEAEEIRHKIGDYKSSELIKKLDIDSKKLELLKLNLKNWQQDKEQTQDKLKKLIEDKNNIEKEELKLQENISTYKNTIKEMKADLDNTDNNLKKIKDEYLGLKSIIKVQNLQAKVEEINKNEKNIEELSVEYFKVSKCKESIEEKINSYQKHIYEIELEFTKTKDTYIEKKRVRDEKYNEIIGITKGESSKLLLASIDETINKLITTEESTRQNLEELRKQYDEYTVEKSSIDGILNTAKEQYENQIKVLNQLLIDYKFISIYEVKKSLLEPAYIRKLHDEITEYNEEQKVLEIKIKELKDILLGRVVKPEVFEELKIKIYNLKSEVNQISKEIGAKQSNLKLLRKSLLKIEELNKEHIKLQEKVNLLEELENVVQGNRFVEYVASNQLKYITLEASKKLNEVTKGRYLLDIDSGLNFVIKDNFNEGKKRTVDTLSGGETFITSLALALALSHQIQLKSNASLEFLFLDEGFDSLDNNLFDDVIYSLNKLHSDKLSIGIISHVKELRNRVPINLIVSSGKELGFGSEVKIEYS